MKIFDRLLTILFGEPKAWWVEIKTHYPTCVYYFGPFDSEAEAQSYKGGYVEDLEQEGAQNIRTVPHHCPPPDQLTITDEWDSPWGDFSTPALSGQS